MEVNVNGIGSIGNMLPFVKDNPVEATRTNSQIFNDFLEAASGIFKEVNTSLNSFEDIQLKVATGESDDFVGLTMAQSKANSSMQFMVQSTNKAIEAYREIMRIQI